MSVVRLRRCHRLLVGSTTLNVYQVARLQLLSFHTDQVTSQKSANNPSLLSFAFLPLPRRTDTFWDQKQDLKEIRNSSQTYVTTKKQLVEKFLLLTKQTHVHSEESLVAGIELTR